MSTTKAYITGFFSSLVLTLAAFIPVMIHDRSSHLSFSHGFLTVWILILAVAQLLVQLFLFLHMGKEKKPYWNLSVFATTVSLILIVVIASVWIMNHLNNNMSPDQVRDYILKEENFFR